MTIFRVQFHFLKMEYNFKLIEKKWQKYWQYHQIYKVNIQHDRPKCYILDMFPYPSGSGLHVGHLLGYIASDIYARYKKLKGFNILHPMGYDAYGLPSEQYAIQTGEHPFITTKENIDRYRKQLDKIGFCFDWKKEIWTCDPSYYKWTQWVFIQMFHSYYCKKRQQARPISELIEILEKKGTKNLKVACTQLISFSANEWKNKTEKEKQLILMNYRIAYLADTVVNWCPSLNTVLANDEVHEGKSIRGNYQIEQRKMRQWSLRVSAYSQRLLNGLNKIDWTESLKEIQRNWIGRSEGVELQFKIDKSESIVSIFTTRPDMIFGVTFIVIAPESDWVSNTVIQEKKEEVNKYLSKIKRRTEKERAVDRTVTGIFTGSYAINPINGIRISIWISDYVLAWYGTGAIMAVPAHDTRDFNFAKHFKLPIIPLIKKKKIELSRKKNDLKEGIMINSDFLNGLPVMEAIQKAKEYIVKNKLGKILVNFRLRDAIFSRQRYWGEPFPIYYKDEVPYSVDEKDLPIKLPEINKYLPTKTGIPPLGRAKDWSYKGYPLELSTMPGFAGSSAYYLRYTDPNNCRSLISKEAYNYWKNVDLYVGGKEHATGHLIYSRFWNKFLFDLGLISEDEPFKKLVNQGMIQGRSNFVYKVKETNTFVSFGLRQGYDVTPIHVDINLVANDVLNIEAFKNWRPEYKQAKFILEKDQYICGWLIEKMSKSLFNVINPDDIVDRFGADTLRLYEMFLGPLEQSKPWSTRGIEGVSRFLKKFWNLFFNNKKLSISEEPPNLNELKSIHKLIKKVSWGIEHFSFNTTVSMFMICVNELSILKCNKRSILSDLVIAISPFAPHISEELWHLLGNKTTIYNTKFPVYNENYLKENTNKYTISFNGKARFILDFPANSTKEELEKIILLNDNTQKWLKDRIPKKIIIVPEKIINIIF